MYFFTLRKRGIAYGGGNSAAVKPRRQQRGTRIIPWRKFIPATVLAKFLTQKFSIFGSSFFLLELCRNTLQAFRLVAAAL